MNIENHIKVTCDQSGAVVDLEIEELGPLSLTTILRKLLKAGWSVSTWRNSYGEFAQHSLADGGWRLIQEWPDCTKRELRKGLSRKNLWITAPGVIPQPPFMKSALAVIDAREKQRIEDTHSPRVKALESQVAYLTAQIQRLQTTEV